MARHHTTLPKRLSFTVYFTEEQHKALAADAAERDISKCQIIRDLVNKWRRETAQAQDNA